MHLFNNSRIPFVLHKYLQVAEQKAKETFPSEI